MPFPASYQLSILNYQLNPPPPLNHKMRIHGFAGELADTGFGFGFGAPVVWGHGQQVL